MVKFGATLPDGRKLIGLGISAENVKLLKQGRPILVRGAEMDLECDITIFYGETEEDMKKDIISFIGPETRLDN